MIGVYTLSPGASGTTKVQYTFETDPPLLSDKIRESLGARSWTRRKAAHAMGRLRSILEDGSRRGVRPTVAGGQ